MSTKITCQAVQGHLTAVEQLLSVQSMQQWMEAEGYHTLTLTLYEILSEYYILYVQGLDVIHICLLPFGLC